MSEKLRILHLEDDVLDHELIVQRMIDDGWDVSAQRVETMEDFRAHLSRSYDAILSDYTIPGADPREALKLARKVCPDVPFVFVSGTIGEEMAIETMKLGAADYVLKQRLPRLGTTLRRALREAKEAAGRRSAERALRESEQRLRLALEIGAIGSFELDIVTRQMKWDPQAQAMLHVPATQDDPWKAVHPDDARALEAALQAAMDLEQRKLFAIDMRFTVPDGSERWMTVRGRMVFDEASSPSRPLQLLGVIQDVTERRRVLEALRDAKTSAERAKEVAEDANRSKDRFLAVLSHELRTPLTAVLPALDALRGVVPAEGRDYLDMATRNTELEARLIDDLLDVTRIARGKIELQRDDVDVYAVLKRAAEVCRGEMTTKGLHFAMRADGGPHTVIGDPARLQQVFWNLLQNAIKFTPHGGCIGILSRRTDSTVEVLVQDSGTGIAPDAMDRIFTAFEQEGRATTRKFGGLGLGLAISKTLVEMHGGSIEASSNGKGLGATFRVRLPLNAVAATPTDGPGGQAEHAHATPPAGLRILLVEDHADTAKILKHLLSRAGHRVQHAPDVATGLAKAREGTFDVLLSDLGLPDATGHSLMQQLVAEGRKLPAIALSGYGMPEDIEKSRAAGFAEHITKPISYARLERALARLVGNSPASPK